jgi:hypothetical protein
MCTGETCPHHGVGLFNPQMVLVAMRWGRFRSGLTGAQGLRKDALVAFSAGP